MEELSRNQFLIASAYCACADIVGGEVQIFTAVLLGKGNECGWRLSLHGGILFLFIWVFYGTLE